MEIAEAGERARRLALDALAGGVPPLPERFPPEVLLFLLTGVPRMIVMEESVRMSITHAETIAFIERYLDGVEPRS